MIWQILSEIGAFIFTGRALLFVLGVILGGMLTVNSVTFYQWMDLMLGWWQALITMVLG